LASGIATSGPGAELGQRLMAHCAQFPFVRIEVALCNLTFEESGFAPDG